MAATRAKYGRRKDGKLKRKPGRKKSATAKIASTTVRKKKRRGRPKKTTSSSSSAGKIILEIRCRKG